MKNVVFSQGVQAYLVAYYNTSYNLPSTLLFYLHNCIFSLH